MKTDEQRQARELRAEGKSVKEIQQALGVSRSSVSLWVRDVPLTSEQHLALVARVREGPLVAGERSAAAARLIRRAYQEEGRRLALERDGSYAAGCMLYWAEGSKKRNVVCLVNSDPDLVGFFGRFLRAHFEVDSGAMRITCNLFADHIDRQREIEAFWLEQLEVPQSCLLKSTVNVYSKYSLK